MGLASSLPAQETAPASTAAPSTASLAPAPQAREYLIVSGGPALRFFERGKKSSHDIYWGNFIRGAHLRIKQIMAEKAPQDEVTWIVFRPAYLRRGEEMGEKLLPQIIKEANEDGVSLFWFDTTPELINYVNQGKNRAVEPIIDFEFFGHSNRNCFLFDYSNDFDAMAMNFFHARAIRYLEPGAFAQGATAKSWGCHTGEYFSDVWKRHLGFLMTGAIGKTDYANGSIPVVSRGGKWNQ